MDLADLARSIEALDARLARLEERLGPRLDEADRLRDALQHERDSRHALAEQARWLIEMLGETRKELRWLRQERERLTADGDGA